MSFLFVPHRGHTGWLLDDNQLLIDEVNTNVGFRRRCGDRVRQKFHDLAGFQPTLRILAEVAVDLHLTISQQLSRLQSGRLRPPAA